MADFRIIPRAEWGAQHERGAGSAPLPAREVWAHHSVTVAPDLLPPFTDDYAAVRTLERIGEQRFKRGISYTFVITPAGLIFEGHGVERLGSHTGGRNSIARAICFIGNYENQDLTDAQREAAAWLLAHGKRSGWWTQAAFNGGHRQAPGASTACPGRHVMDDLGHINARAAQLLGGPNPAAAAPAPSGAPVLREGSRGPAVADWQRILIGANLLPAGAADGVFGPATKAATVAVQRKLNVSADGIVGAGTRAATDALLRLLTAPAPAPKRAGADLAAVDAHFRLLPNPGLLRSGSKGEAVKAAQWRLTALGHNPGPCDGVFGAGTRGAVIAFQRSRGIVADGVVGSATRRALGLAV